MAPELEAAQNPVDPPRNFEAGVWSLSRVLRISPTAFSRTAFPLWGKFRYVEKAVFVWTPGTRMLEHCRR